MCLACKSCRCWSFEFNLDDARYALNVFCVFILVHMLYMHTNAFVFVPDFFLSATHGEFVWP